MATATRTAAQKPSTIQVSASTAPAAAPTKPAESASTAKIALLFGLWYVLNIGYNISNKKLLNLAPNLVYTAALLQVSIGLRPLDTVRQRLRAIRTGAEARLGSAFPDEVRPLVAEVDELLNQRPGQHLGPHHQGALADVDFVIKHDSTNTGAYRLRGVIHDKMGDTASAASDYAAADNLVIHNMLEHKR